MELFRNSQGGAASECIPQVSNAQFELRLRRSRRAAIFVVRRPVEAYDAQDTR